MDDERKQHLDALLTIHKNNLYKLETQAAQYGQLNVPIHITNEIKQEKDSINYLESQLRNSSIINNSLNVGEQRPKPWHNLPQPDHKHFVGREEEIKTIIACLHPDDQVFQILIAGIGGVGKTSLALKIAHEYVKMYDILPKRESFDAIIWVSAKKTFFSADGLTEIEDRDVTRNIDQIYSVIARTLDREDITREADPERRDELVRKALSNPKQRILLIVDNMEMMGKRLSESNEVLPNTNGNSIADREEEDKKRVMHFLRYLRWPTKIILTSREAIDVASIVELSGLPENDAFLLVSESAKNRADLTDDQKKEIVKYTEGIPLSIKYSIGRLADGQDFASVREWLDIGGTFDDLPAYCVEEQVNLIRNKYKANVWPLLVGCALHDPEWGASRDAVRVTTGLTRKDCDEAIRKLRRLYLLQVIFAHKLDGSKQLRYRIPRIAQRYVYSLFIKESKDFQENLYQGWLTRMKSIAIQYHESDIDLHIDKSSDMDIPYINLLHGIRWCFENKRWDDLIFLSKGAWSYAYLTGSFVELREILECGIVASKAISDGYTEGKFSRRLGHIDRLQGKKEEAFKRLDRAEELARMHNDKHELGLTLYMQAGVSFDHGDIDSTKTYIELLSFILGETLDPELSFLVAMRSAQIADQLDDPDEALRLLSPAEEWVKQLNWEGGLARLWYRRAVCLIHLQRYEEALYQLQDVLEVFTRSREKRLEAQTYHRLAELFAQTNRDQDACRYAYRALDLFVRIGVERKIFQVKSLINTLSCNEEILNISNQDPFFSLPDLNFN